MEEKGSIQHRYAWRRPKRTEYRFRWPDRLVPHVPFIIFFILAAFQYDARLTGDTSMVTFQVINHEFFWAPQHNIGLYLSQIMPLAGIWLGFDMRVILLLFSLSHVAFYYILFLAVYYGMGDRRSGLMILLVLTFGIVHSFFAPASPLFYSVALLIVFYALLRLNIRVTLMTVFLLVVEITALLTHPVALLFFPFILLFEFNRDTLKDFWLYIVLLLVYGAVFWYEYAVEKSNFLQIAIPFFPNIHPTVFTRDVSRITRFLVSIYPELIIAIPIAWLGILKGRKWLRLAITTTVSIYWLSLLPGIIDLTPLLREQAMFPLIFFTTTAVVYSYPKAWNPGAGYLSIFFISLLIMLRILIIYNHSALYVMRAHQIAHLSETAWKYSGSKFIARSEVINRYHVASTNTYPLESLLISSCYGTDRGVTIIPDKSTFTSRLKEKYILKDFFMSPDQVFPVSGLSNFRLHLDIGPYRPLNLPKINQPIHELADLLSIDILAKKFYKASDTAFIPVRISFAAKDTLFTGGENKVYLSYFWLSNNEPLEWNNILTPLDTDVIKELRQDVQVCIPGKQGWYELNIDLNINGQWLGARTKKRILVY